MSKPTCQVFVIHDFSNQDTLPKHIESKAHTRHQMIIALQLLRK